jgi:tRNA pseudouridine32 synthase/23S rRNA pseudouridine746 synthase
MSMVYAPPADQGLDIIYQDDHLLAINKPAELLAVPGRGEDRQDSLASRVQQAWPAALIVHRLDMSTSGIMLMALSTSMQRQLGILFQQRKVDKCYQAVVNGRLDAEQADIDLPLICDWPNRPRQKVDRLQGKPSLTRYRVLSYDATTNSSRLELSPVTGRSHQLRVHMQAIGHPILGDRLYADSGVQNQSPRLLLHASHLSLIHPHTGESLSIASPAPF